MKEATGGIRMEMYEDMFKEITRKLYGNNEDDKDSNDAAAGVLKMVSAQFTTADDSSKKEDHSISSFSLNSLMDSSYSQMSSLQSSPFSSIDKLEDDRWISSEETLEWTNSKIASYNSVQKLFRCNECECVGYLSRVAEHWLGTHANLRVFQCPQCAYSSAWARCVRMHLARQHNVCQEQSETGAVLWKESPVLEEVTKYLQRLKAKIEDEHVMEEEVEEEGVVEEVEESSQPLLIHEQPEEEQLEEQQQQQQQLDPSPPPPEQPPSQPEILAIPSPPSTVEFIVETKPAEVQTDSPKRYNCAFCHYATDRRDLYTRHENIHKEEKP
ncbi:zinc finger protein 462-like, partial [Nilaparvata lugens]|uniref:zinc finger protein 462-like n=1 Tax=Nilaparvata lugens TaxID=108931 RepID=UPI00193DE77C